MTQRVIRIAGWLAAALAAGIGAADPVAAPLPLRWQRLPSIPDREGFAGAFAGVSGGALVVAGGANFPDRRPWEGGTKHWYDTIFVLPQPAGNWHAAGRLPQPLAYGISVSTPEGLICIGGGDAQAHCDRVFCLRWELGRIVVRDLPRLPRPCAFGCGALVGNALLVAGGIEKPADTACLRSVWRLDLGTPTAAWQELPPCPGPERMLAVAGAVGGSFYLFSGARLAPGADGKAVRAYLCDAWRYTPAGRWQRLADLPRPAVAAASPAVLAHGRMLVVSGDDGKHVGFQPEPQHPGFPRDVLAYDVRSDSWTVAGEAPFSRATLPTAVWGQRIILPNGEVRPGYRTPEVWSLEVGR